MIISVETKFDIGDVVYLSSDEPLIATKMAIRHLEVDANMVIVYDCQWMVHGTMNRMAVPETSLCSTKK